MADHSGKTEEPTQRRLEKARKEGQYPSAREFVSALQFMIFLFLLGAMGAQWMHGFRETARSLFAFPFSHEITPETLSRIAWQLFWRHLLPLAGAGVAVAVATLGLRLVTT